MKLVSDHAVTSGNDLHRVFGFLQTYRAGVPESQVLADLTFGNPLEPPLPDLVAALRTHVEPKSADWFAYKMSEASLPAFQALAPAA